MDRATNRPGGAEIVALMHDVEQGWHESCFPCKITDGWLRSKTMREWDLGGSRAFDLTKALRRRFVATLPVALLAVCLWACGPMAHAQTKFVTDYMLDRDNVEIPFEYTNHQILVHGQADTQKDLTFLFDSGASAPVLDKALGLTGTHIKDTVVQEAEGATNAEAIWLSDLSIGNQEGKASVHNIATLLTDLTQMSKLLGRKIDGIIGITFMAGFVTEVDYAKKVLHFYNPNRLSLTDRKPDNKRTFLFNLGAFSLRAVPCVTLSGKLHEKYDYSFLLDTGFGGYVSVAQASAVEAGLMKADTPRISTTNYGMSRRFISNKIRAAYLTLGEVNLSGHIISVDVRNNDIYGQGGIVGNRFLQNYHLILDYPHRKLWLERVTDKEEPDDSERLSLGISVRADGKTYKIDTVAKYSPAQRSGARPGDTVVSINGQALQGLGTAQVLNMLASPRGTTVLVVQRGVDPNLGTPGNMVTLTIEPQSPLDWKTD